MVDRATGNLSSTPGNLVKSIVAISLRTIQVPQVDLVSSVFQFFPFLCSGGPPQCYLIFTPLSTR